MYTLNPIFFFKILTLAHFVQYRVLYAALANSIAQSPRA